MPEDFLKQFMLQPPKKYVDGPLTPLKSEPKIKNRKLGEDLGSDFMDFVLGAVGAKDFLDPEESSATVLGSGATAGLLPWGRTGKGALGLIKKAKGWVAPASAIPEIKLAPGAMRQVDSQKIFDIMKGREAAKVGLGPKPTTLPLAKADAPKPTPIGTYKGGPVTRKDMQPLDKKDHIVWDDTVKEDVTDGMLSNVSEFPLEHPDNFPPFSGVEHIPEFTPEQKRESARMMSGLFDPVKEANIKKAWDTAAERYPRQVGNITNLTIDDFGGAQNGTQMSTRSRTLIDAFSDPMNTDYLGNVRMPKLPPHVDKTSAVRLSRDRNEVGTPRFSGDVLETLLHETKHADDQARIPNFERKYMDQQRDVGYDANPYETRARDAAASAMKNPRTRKNLIGGPPTSDAIRIPITEGGRPKPQPFNPNFDEYMKGIPGPKFSLNPDKIPAFRSKAGMAIDTIDDIQNAEQAEDFAYNLGRIGSSIKNDAQGEAFDILEDTPEYIAATKSRDDALIDKVPGNTLKRMMGENDSDVDSVINELADYFASPKYDPNPRGSLKLPPDKTEIDDIMLADDVNGINQPTPRDGETTSQWVDRVREERQKPSQFIGGLADDQDTDWMDAAMGNPRGTSRDNAAISSIKDPGSVSHPKFNLYLSQLGIGGTDTFWQQPRQDRIKIMEAFQNWLNRGGR